MSAADLKGEWPVERVRESINGVGMGGAWNGRTLAVGRQASIEPNKVAKENTASPRKVTLVLPNHLNCKFAKLCIHPEVPNLA